MAGLSARDYGGGLSTAGSSIVRAIGFSPWVCSLTEEEADASVSLEIGNGFFREVQMGLYLSNLHACRLGEACYPGCLLDN